MKFSIVASTTAEDTDTKRAKVPSLLWGLAHAHYWAEADRQTDRQTDRRGERTAAAAISRVHSEKTKRIAVERRMDARTDSGIFSALTQGAADDDAPSAAAAALDACRHNGIAGINGQKNKKKAKRKVGTLTPKSPSAQELGHFTALDGSLTFSMMPVSRNS